MASIKLAFCPWCYTNDTHKTPHSKTAFIYFWQIRISTAPPLPKDSHAAHALCWQQDLILCNRNRKKLHKTKQFLSTYLQQTASSKSIYRKAQFTTTEVFFYNFESHYFGRFVKLLLFTFNFFKKRFLPSIPKSLTKTSEGQNPVCWFPAAHRSNEARNHH